MFELFLKLVIGHALCDYPLQGDFLGKNKHWNATVDWWIYMLAHCLIHAGMVWVITGRIGYALMELLVHFLIDCGKNGQLYGIRLDQYLHVFCKLIYAMCLCL